MTYCVRCRDHTSDSGKPRIETAANGRRMQKSVCGDCGTNKTKFMSGSGFNAKFQEELDRTRNGPKKTNWSDFGKVTIERRAPSRLLSYAPSPQVGGELQDEDQPSVTISPISALIADWKQNHSAAYKHIVREAKKYMKIEHRVVKNTTNGHERLINNETRRLKLYLAHAGFKTLSEIAALAES